jgi:hypothetical protein
MISLTTITRIMPMSGRHAESAKNTTYLNIRMSFRACWLTC